MSSVREQFLGNKLLRKVLIILDILGFYTVIFGGFLKLFSYEK